MIKLVSDTINKDDINELCNWLQQEPIPQLTKGPLTKQLEWEWAEKIGTKYSVFVNSGSSAILLALAALKQMKKIETKNIIVPALSWATDYSSPSLLGLNPILVDCNLEDLSIDLVKLEAQLMNNKCSAVILVSVLGLVPDMEAVVKLCKKYNVLLIEDCCESMGSKYSDKYLGTFGYCSIFSMYYGHHLSTIEGGFINTNDESFYHMLLMMRSHGWDRDLPQWKQDDLRRQYKVSDFDALYNFYVPGFNLRSTDLQAFLGLRAIDKLDEVVAKRCNNYYIYDTFINNNQLKLRSYFHNGVPIYISNFAYPMVNVSRNEIVKELQNNNIEVRPLIAGNMGNKPMYYEGPHYWNNYFPNADLVDKFGFYLPNHADLTLKDINKIISIVNKY